MSRLSNRLIAPLLALIALPALAVDGQVPIPFASPVVTPIVITTPGSYVVTRNLTPTGPGPIITIAVPGTPGDVQIDLNGFVLDNTPNPTDPVIRVLVGASSEATIRNGTLIGGGGGIEAVGPARKLVVEDVKISDFTGAGPPAGIYMLDVLNYVIRRNEIIDSAGAPGGPAIWIDGGIPRQGIIEHNLIRRTADGIIALPLASSVEISNNRLLEIVPGGPFGAAINLDGASSCLIAQNTIDGAFAALGVTGIQLNFSQGCKLYNNVVGNMGVIGIALNGGSDDNLVLDNVIRGSGGDGLWVDGAHNHIERNVLNANGAAGFGFGLHFGPGSVDNTYGGNTSRGNVGGACLFVPPVEPCAAIGGGGSSFPPEFCNEGPGFIGNTSFCDNLMPGPPRS